MAKTQDENLITLVLADTSIKGMIGDRMHFGHVPETTPFPRIRFERTGTMRDGCLDDAAGDDPTRENFLVEIQARDEREAETLKGLVIDRLNCYRGSFGDTTCQGIFAEDWSSAHQQRGGGTDAGLWIVTGPVEVVL